MLKTLFFNAGKKTPDPWNLIFLFENVNSLFSFLISKISLFFAGPLMDKMLNTVHHPFRTWLRRAITTA
jgi:hypothetical protein